MLMKGSGGLGGLGGLRVSMGGSLGLRRLRGLMELRGLTVA